MRFEGAMTWPAAAFELTSRSMRNADLRLEVTVLMRALFVNGVTALCLP